MKFSGSFVRIVSVVALLGCVVAASAGSVSTTPTDRNNKKWWPPRHAAKVALAKQGNVDLVFIGDSITFGFESSGKGVWEKYYAPRHALNLGFGGDKTENVLWRLENGEIDGIAPKLAILMIGTNNTGQRNEKPELICDGVKAICDRLQAKLPDTKVLILAIFPRSANASDPPRVNNEAANKLIAGLADNKRIFFLDINSKFLGADGSLSPDIMPDYLHPQEKGYGIWAEAMEPTVVKLMGEAATKRN